MPYYIYFIILVSDLCLYHTSQPVKMMRYRGSDDAIIGFGHFCEVRRVKEGPSDVVPLLTPAGISDEDMDQYAAKQLSRRSVSE